MMPSSTSNSYSSQDHQEDSPSTAIQLVMCHEAAITLNNFIVTKLLLRDRNFPAASTTYRDVIYLIKKCIMPPSDTTSPATSGTITADEIHEIVHNAYQRAAELPPSEPEDPMEVQDDGSFQNRSDDEDEDHVHIQVISNCLPCSNVVTSRYNTTMTTTTTTPTARSIVSGNGNVTSSQLTSSLAARVRIEASILPNTSLHSTVSSSTVASQATTTSVNSTPITNKAATTTVADGTTATLATTAASTHMDDTVDDRLTTMSVYPMTIDDYHMNCAHPDLMNIHTNVADDDPRIVHHQQFVEYHAAIILYNFGIIHQCLGMTENDTPMIDAEDEQNPGTRISNSNTIVEPSSMNGTAIAASVPMTIDGSGNQDMHHQNDDVDDHHHDDRSPKRLLASYKIMTNTLSWIHELVQPIMDEVLNESNEDAQHTNVETSTSLATTPGDHYYMNKYLQVMVLINYHVLDIIDTLHFPNGPYEYHCTMMNEILNFISYLEIFYPSTSHNNNNDKNNFGNGNTRGSASPAA